MDASGESFAPYFYIHFPIIHELWVLVPLTSFEVGFLTAINVTPSQITPNKASENILECIARSNIH